MSTTYLPAENAQLTKLHSEAMDHINDRLIALQDQTAAAYKAQIDRLLDAMIALLASEVRAQDISQAYALIREMRKEEA